MRARGHRWQESLWVMKNKWLTLFLLVNEIYVRWPDVLACISCCSQATDRDSGVNRQIDFKVTEVQFRNQNNQTSTMRILFDAVTTQQKDVYVGIIQWVQSHRHHNKISQCALNVCAFSKAFVLTAALILEYYGTWTRASLWRDCLFSFNKKLQTSAKW